MMKPRIDMLGIVTLNLEKMRDFYRDVLDFDVIFEMPDNYVELANDGVRFALTTRTVMYDCTGEREYLTETKGHTFELAFRSESPEEVDTDYDCIITKGAKPVKGPADMPWGQRTAFFADPDGHIHEIFADIPKDKE